MWELFLIMRELAVQISVPLYALGQITKSILVVICFLTIIIGYIVGKFKTDSANKEESED